MFLSLPSLISWHQAKQQKPLIVTSYFSGGHCPEPFFLLYLSQEQVLLFQILSYLQGSHWNFQGSCASAAYWRTNAALSCKLGMEEGDPEWLKTCSLLSVQLAPPVGSSTASLMPPGSSFLALRKTHLSYPLPFPGEDLCLEDPAENIFPLP